MANLQLHGPFSWVRPFGQNAMMPGDGHYWAIGPFNPSGAAFAVSIHPTRDEDHQAVAAEALSTAYARTGPPNVNFLARNVSDTPVFSYRIFVAVIDF
jgi:hypothetical protein